MKSDSCKRSIQRTELSIIIIHVTIICPHTLQVRQAVAVARIPPYLHWLDKETTRCKLLKARLIWRTSTGFRLTANNVTSH